MATQDTLFFKGDQHKEMVIRGIVEKVYAALKEKGYNPVNQIVGYIISGDPTYITSHEGARSLITQIQRDDLLEEIVKNYLNQF
ncbi:MAG: IreB family regulatory phosphoprotein [Clostridia bacterium]|nr:IreB family regulatory phosphoprotein [Clostridia bacterium]